VLRADGVAFRYRADGPWVLDGIDLAIGPGEVVGLSAPSGRGKTTLARILAGYLGPDRGTVTVDAQPLPKTGVCPVQLVFQHPELAVNPRWRIERILTEAGLPERRLLQDLGVEESWFGRWPHELSGGELQRVAVARALAAESRYLIADEMTTMLDAITQAQLWDVMLREARGRAMGLLAISHSEPLLVRISDRLVGLPEAKSV
jgi:ABC-type dipeptide/oligopeptide/nickel transport system ATPase subunit